MLRIRNWEKWQSYRSDRGQPPWIKIHREVMRNPEWVSLSDSQRGQLVSMWLLAADKNGEIPENPKVIQKLCFMDSMPDLNLFIDHGFIQADANSTPTRRQLDANSTSQSRVETETEKSREEKIEETDSVESDDLKFCFSAGLKLLGEKKRSLIGRMVKKCGPEIVADVIAEIEARDLDGDDLTGYFVKICEGKKADGAGGTCTVTEGSKKGERLRYLGNGDYRNSNGETVNKYGHRQGISSSGVCL